MAKITGTAGIDTLNGTIGNDTINGLAGADTMIGGLGYDVYYVDDVNDVVTEAPGEGTDKVISSVSYTLGANVEHLTLTGSANINAIGNTQDNSLTGNRGNNILNGGAGVDVMNGGAGDDTYFINVWAANGINDKNSGTDYIIDSSGIDTVILSGGQGPAGGEFVYVMQKGLENAQFVFTDSAPAAGDSAAVTVTGNSSRNIIVTGDGDDILNGMTGADTLDGGDGANIYVIDNKGDVIIDGFDDSADDDLKDTAQIYKSYVMNANAEVEIVTLMGTKTMSFTGSDADNTITGNTATNTIHGGLGDDIIDGGGGFDKLYGDAGADTFKFSSETAFTKAVRIMDFSLADGDKLDISDILTNYDDNITITNWLRITDSGNDSIVEVDANGGGDNFVKIATLYGINGLTGETALLIAGTIIPEVAP